LGPELTAALIVGELRDRAAKGLGHFLRQSALLRMKIFVIRVGSRRLADSTPR
jgi:hypothetical protein